MPTASLVQFILSIMSRILICQHKNSSPLSAYNMLILEPLVFHHQHSVVLCCMIGVKIKVKSVHSQRILHTFFQLHQPQVCNIHKRPVLLS